MAPFRDNAWARLAVLGPIGLALYIAIQLAVGAIAHWAGAAWRPEAIIVSYAIAVPLAVVAYRRAMARTEGRTADALSALPDSRFGWGLLIGGGLLTATQAIAMLFGASRIGGIAGFGHAGLILLSSAFAAVGEEIVFRGIIFRLLARASNTIVAAIASALLFGALHLLNPGATLIGCLAIAIEAGVMLSIAFAVTGDLWFPIGIHLGWNFFEGGVFGSAISAGAAQGIFATDYTGSPWLTGGSFGLEASFTATLLCLLASAALVVWRRRRPA